MKVCGFTIIRNAIKFDYPVEESIRSVLPLVDKFIVAVGKSEDKTRELIAGIDPHKIEIIDTVWDDSLREGGAVLAKETNIAYQAIDKSYDWAFYIQADEVVHEQYYLEIRKSMEKWKDDSSVEALVFNYLHFYGSYDYVGDSRQWYRREARIVRVREDIYSYRDAQGFRKGNEEKLNGKLIAAYICHYGWVKHPRFQQLKQESFHKMWHDDAWMKENVKQVNEFDYSGIRALRKFDGAHPLVMQKRIEKVNWKFSFDPTKRKDKFKDRLSAWIEQKTGWRPGEFKNYKLV